VERLRIELLRKGDDLVLVDPLLADLVRFTDLEIFPVILVQNFYLKTFSPQRRKERKEDQEKHEWGKVHKVWTFRRSMVRTLRCQFLRRSDFRPVKFFFAFPLRLCVFAVRV
jgi:hypothetical protein